MQIKVRHDHYVHLVNDDRLDSINTKLDLILETMAKKTDFDQLTERFNASHTAISESLANVADDVRRLTEGMTPSGGLTEAEATEVFSALDAKASQIEDIATQIRSLADQTPEQPTEPEA
jgi:methyl-accepting chemotaxis protein